MGRPDLTAVRTAEILDAFEQCVARFGLEGSSLERVAEEAGMKRSILRHYVGNREDLVQALADRVVSKFRRRFDEFRESISESSQPAQLLEFFFPKQPLESTESILVVEALIAASGEYPAVQTLMLGYIDDLVSGTASELQTAFPESGRTRCWEVAYGVVSICFNQESLSPLGLSPRYLRSARNCSKLLLESLES